MLRARGLTLVLLLAGGVAHGAPESQPTSRPAATAAEPTVTTTLDVRLDADRGRSAGHVRIDLVNPTAAPLDRAYVWLYPNRFATRPAALNDVNFYWVYPRKFSPGSMSITAARTPAGPAKVTLVAHAYAGAGVLAELALAAPILPGATARLDLDFDARLPERLGTFGCTRGSCTLAGGYYPMLATLDAAGWDLAAPPARSRFAGVVTLATDADWVASGEPGQGPVIPIAADDQAYFPLRVAPVLHPQRATRRGVTLVYLAQRDPPAADDAADQTLPYSEEDYGGMALAAAGEAVDLLAEIGAPVPPGTRITLVEAPLRLELASPQPGVVYVSDRLFRIFPVKRFRKFHERQLVRAVFGTLWAARIAAAGRERPRDVDVIADVAASYLVDLYTVREYAKSEFARDVLSPVSFVPAVDELLYAPQVAFADAYFGDVGDADPFRDDPRRFSHPRPKGRLYYEKLRDLLTPEQLGDAMRGILVEGKTLREAAEAVYGKPLGWFFRQWGRAYPHVNYRLGRRWKEPAGRATGTGTGTSAGATVWRWHVEVLKIPSPGEHAPVEPVAVRAIDGDGHTHALTWDGEGDRADLTFESGATSLSSVEIDPLGRLVETSPPGDTADPRFDDRDPPRWRFLYNNFGALLNVSDFSLVLAADFSFKRVHDSTNSLRFSIFRSSAVDVGVFSFYSRAFGTPITGNRREKAWTIGLGATRLNGDFGRQVGEAPLPGTQVTTSISMGGDDRLFIFEPLHAVGWGVAARYTLTDFDGGSVLQSYSAAADATRIGTPWDGVTLVGAAEGAVVGGDLQARSQLVAGGGASRLRGYAPGSLFGRALLLAHGEARLAFRHDLDTNVGHFLWLHGIGGAAFVDAGALSGCDQYGDLFAGKNLFADVGVGLRFFYDNLGVQPGMMALDVAFPLMKRQRSCFDAGMPPATVGSSPPFMLYLTFLPPF